MRPFFLIVVIAIFSPALAGPDVVITSPAQGTLISDPKPTLEYSVQGPNAAVTEIRLISPCRGFWDWCWVHLMDSDDNWLPSGSTFALAPSDSAYRVRIVATDDTGTTTVESFFTLDGLAPRVEIGDPTHGQVFSTNDTVNLGYNISDDHEAEHWDAEVYVPTDVTGLSDVTILLDGVPQPAPAFTVGARELAVSSAPLSTPASSAGHALHTVEIVASDGFRAGSGLRSFLRRKGVLDFDLRLTGEAARVGHPVTFDFDQTFLSLTLELGGQVVGDAVASDRVAYTPLATGAQTLILTVDNGTNTIVEDVDMFVVDQHLGYVPRFEPSSRPMISLWKSKPYETGLGIDDYAAHHLARAVWIHDRNFPYDSQYQRMLSPQVIATDLYSTHDYGATEVNNIEIVDQLEENWLTGQDLVLMPLKFPHVWQFNATDYSATQDPIEQLWWESPFAVDGPAELAQWFLTMFQQIRSELATRICPTAPNCTDAEIDHLVLDWEQFINRNNYLSPYPNVPSPLLPCTYQVFNIWSSHECDAYEEATREDPRFAAAGGDPDDMAVWDSGLSWGESAAGEAAMLTLRAVLEGERERILRDAFFQPFAQINPGGLFSQWLYYRTGYPDDVVTDNLGFPLFGTFASDAANTASPVHYFSQAHPNLGCFYSDDEVRRHPIDLLRNVARNEVPGRPLIPWVTDPSSPRDRVSNHNPGVPFLDDQEQWEAFAHLLFSGATSFNFWNHPDPRLTHVVQNAWGTFLNTIAEGSVPVTTGNLEPGSVMVSATQDPDGLVHAMVTFLCETDPATILGCDDCDPATECICPGDAYADSTTFLGHSLERPPGRTFGIYTLDVPQGDVLIDGGATTTFDVDVFLDLSADADAIEMRVWNDGDAPGGFVAFQPSIPWTLVDGPDGPRTVHAQFRRAGGVESTVASDDILFDGEILFWFQTRVVSEWQQDGYDAWNVYRGDLAVLKAGGDYTQVPGSNPAAARVCGLAAPTVSDLYEPGAGNVAFYLVTGVTSGVESDLGFDSGGVVRMNGNPCP